MANVPSSFSTTSRRSRPRGRSTGSSVSGGVALLGAVSWRICSRFWIRSRVPSPVAPETRKTSMPGNALSSRSAFSRASGRSTLFRQRLRALHSARRTSRAHCACFVVRYWVLATGIQDVDNHPRALDVAQELMPEADALVRALDQSRQVRHHERVEPIRRRQAPARAS